MAIPGFTKGQFTTGDISVAYETAGHGPPVLLLHGYPQNRMMWMKVAPFLTKDYTVVCADLRGYGGSSKPVCLANNSNYSFRSLADDQWQLMNHLGFTKFHVIGHDRGARTAHRMALDHPDAVLTLTVMDIVPTYAMLHESDYLVAKAYWHWYFLQQPAPFPERLIGKDPDYFYENCLLGWGSTSLADFDPVMLAAYRHAWHDPEMIHGSCSDYRAAASIDLEHDHADLHKKVKCETLVLYGREGVMARHYNIPAQWEKRCERVQGREMQGGHFFVDQYPDETAQSLLQFLKTASSCTESL